MTDTVLLEHGTEFSRLKPRNVIQAACNDLKLAREKQEFSDVDDKPYSFARQHVRRSRGHLELLLALAYCEPTPATDKRSTLIIYSDRELLRLALIEQLTHPPEVP